MTTFHIENTSHLDHHLTPAHLAFVVETFKDRSGFFIETVELPEGLEPLPSGLYGPAVGDEEVEDEEAFMAIRVGRPWASRFVDKPQRTTRLLTVVAGPTLDCPDECVMYTAHGGPSAPREPGDFSLAMVCKDHMPLWKAQMARDLVDEFDPGELVHQMSTCDACLEAQNEMTRSIVFWERHALSVHDCTLVENSRDARLRNMRSKSSLFHSVRDPGTRAKATCDTCKDNMDCCWAYYTYNLDGACLRETIKKRMAWEKEHGLGDMPYVEPEDHGGCGGL